MLIKSWTVSKSNKSGTGKLRPLLVSNSEQITKTGNIISNSVNQIIKSYLDKKN